RADVDRPGSVLHGQLWINRPALASELDDVFGRGALGALDDVELNALAFGERAESVALDRRVVNEAVLLSAFGGDKAKALSVVEPLHRAGRACHGSTP